MNPTTTRRQALALTAVAVAFPVATAATSFSGEHPDAELFELEKEMEAIHARMERAMRISDRVEEKIRASLPPQPEPHPIEYWKKSPPMPADVAASFDTMSLDDFRNKRFPPAYAAWSEAIENEKSEEQAKAEAAWEEWHALYRERCDEYDLDALNDKYEAIVVEEFEFGRRMCAVPAQTLEGIAVKLRVSDRLDLDASEGNMAIDSIIADIRRLTATGKDAS